MNLMYAEHAMENKTDSMEYAEKLFRGISSFGDGKWTVRALIIVILRKAPSRREVERSLVWRSPETIFNIRRLNVWFMQGCGMREERTLDDVEAVWCWINNNHPSWADWYQHGSALEINEVLRAFEEVQRKSLDSQIGGPVPASVLERLIIERAFGAGDRKRFGCLADALLSGTNDACHLQLCELVDHMLDFRQFYMKGFRILSLIGQCLNDNMGSCQSSECVRNLADLKVESI